ncbi:hypothetical protein Ethha_0588 [Ethanoligenens harbinense YUAN-3]|uniref:Uncharacterized protein n=1 Tax=Ethanoligenens harbinense (strain DSM 18485 / JCM 12961 / CGMCC 1.5033 / YUAN-3) TaxID=663278 RepID=E6U9H4_ETHHY|nr:hypothetical protein Ethha_0588 [Ethanoligenens harbinense YUAN-3]
MIDVCTNRHKLLACVKCPGSVNCPEYAGKAKKYKPQSQSEEKWDVPMKTDSFSERPGWVPTAVREG